MDADMFSETVPKHGSDAVATWRALEAAPERHTAETARAELDRWLNGPLKGVFDEISPESLEHQLRHLPPAHIPIRDDMKNRIVRARPRPMPLEKQEAIRAQVKVWTEMGIGSVRG